MVVHVGDVGRALSPMTPSGAVEVRGRRLDARSDGQFIEAGSPVIVLRGDPSGYVVRKLEAGQPPPELPGHGEPIRRAEFQRNSAEVAEAERQERAERRERLLQGLQTGSVAAGSLGAVVGLASGGVGWYFGWSGAADPLGLALLFGGSLVAGAVVSVALFFLTGLVGSVAGAFEGEPGFAPDFFAMFAGLVGGAVGFWWRFGTGDAGVIAAWSAGGALAFAVVAWVLGRLMAHILGSAAGA
jgi:hypothetical protein